MIDRLIRKNWIPITISTSIFVTLLVLFLLVHDFWYVSMQCKVEEANFYSASSSSEQATSLANLFRTEGWIVSGECGEKAKALFYGELPSADEQMALFDANPVIMSDLITLVQGLYGADLNTSDVNALLSAKRLVSQEQYIAAVYEYDEVINANGTNLALLSERASILIEVDNKEEALADIEQVLTLAEKANEPTSEQISQQSLALIEQNSELAETLRAAPEGKYPKINEIIASTRVATATETLPTATKLTSPTLSPTPSSTRTITLPTLEASPTLSATVTGLTMTPTSTLTVTSTSTLTNTRTTMLTSTPTSTLTLTPTAVGTLVTPTELAALTRVPPTQTFVATAVPPQQTATGPIGTASSTPLPPSNTPFVPSNTPVRPSNTPFVPSNTPFVPSNTPVRPSNTPFVPSSTPFMPSSTPFMPSNTPFVPSNTPFIPTNTPLPPSNTPFVPTNTPIPPSNTPFVPTNTPVPPSNTPFVPTNTPIPPSNTPFVPTNTPVVPTNTPIPPTNIPAARAVITLLAPNDGASYSSSEMIPFTWQGGGNLEDNQYFDLRIWKVGDPHWGVVDAYNTNYSYRASALGGGEYEWSVAIMDRATGMEVVQEASPRRLTISGPSATSTPPSLP